MSWGVYRAEGPNPPYSEVLDGIARAGYDGTELGPYGYLPTARGELEEELRARGLLLASSYVPIPLEDAEERESAVRAALEVAALLARHGVSELILAGEEHEARAAIAGRVPKDGTRALSDAEWKETAMTLHAIARVISDRFGMRAVVHHHAGTFIETEEEIARLLWETDPDLVGLLVDTGHAVYGGADPLELIQRHGDRLRYVHLKDARASEIERVRNTDIAMSEAWRRGVFCSLGDGVVDFERIVEKLRTLGYDGWVIVEQDVIPNERGLLEPDPLVSATRSREYLREVAGL